MTISHHVWAKYLHPAAAQISLNTSDCPCRGQGGASKPVIPDSGLESLSIGCSSAGLTFICWVLCQVTSSMVTVALCSRFTTFLNTSLVCLLRSQNGDENGTWPNNQFDTEMLQAMILASANGQLFPIMLIIISIWLHSVVPTCSMPSL